MQQEIAPIAVRPSLLWHEVPDAFASEIAADFGSASAWRREFVGTAQSLAGGSGWVLLTYSRRQKRFWNQIATDHTQAAVDAAPVLVLDMYEHAYQMDFGGNATAYVDARQRNHMSRHVDLMAGPVAVYCSWGFDVGRNVTKTLIERGFDARFVRAASRRGTPRAARALRPAAG